MHKLIRCSERKISRRYNLLLLALNIPSITAAAVLAVISLLIIRNFYIPDELFGIFFTVLYCASLYSFAVTLMISAVATVKINGHKKYTYMEILGEQMIVSEYTSTVYEHDGFVDYRRIWLINLADVEQVTCTRNKIIIKGAARRIEQRADWLEYSSDELGRVDFDYWWYNDNGGDSIHSVEFKDNYTYAERAAQRIIFCSAKQKDYQLRRDEFRKRMLEIAGRKNKGRKKKKERIFRGYEIERKF